MFGKLVRPVIEYVNYLSFIFSQVLVLCFLVLTIAWVTGFLFFVPNKEPWLVVIQFSMYGIFAYFVLEILGWVIAKLIPHIHLSLFFGSKSRTVRVLEIESGILLACTMIAGIVTLNFFARQPWWNEKNTWLRAVVRTPSTGAVLLLFATFIRKSTLKLLETKANKAKENKT